MTTDCRKRELSELDVCLWCLRPWGVGIPGAVGYTSFAGYRQTAAGTPEVLVAQQDRASVS